MAGAGTRAAPAGNGEAPTVGEEYSNQAHTYEGQVFDSTGTTGRWWPVWIVCRTKGGWWCICWYQLLDGRWVVEFWWYADVHVHLMDTAY